MKNDNSIDEWRAQIKRGTLEFCILLMIGQRPCYGYDLINRLEKWPILTARESRLLKEEYLSSFWQDTAEGLPPRKYYAITDKGKEYLGAMSREWENLLSAIAEIKEREDS